MRICAYPEIYVSKAQALLGEAFDYAIHVNGLSGEGFVGMFLVGDYSKRLAKGDVACLRGMSGVELARDIYFKATLHELPLVEAKSYARSADYWIGWALAYYQWNRGVGFDYILNAVPYEKLRAMYPVFHEMDITHLVEALDARLAEAYQDTNLRRQRENLGLSQSALARKAQVSLRSIQMYEQRNKDINKASAETVYRLSRALGCAMEDLLERG